MNPEILTKHFQAIGARLKVRPLSNWRSREGQGLQIDIKNDSKGEYFDLAYGPNAPELSILQVKPEDRHLLLYGTDGQRFLAGHDERHWFVAPIGEQVSTVRDAKLALLPPVIASQTQSVRPDTLQQRRNEHFKRQGEWFFQETTEDLRGLPIHRNEPLQRTPRNKPHVCSELIRRNGETVYLYERKQYNQKEWEKVQQEPNFNRKLLMRTMTRNAEIFVRGPVRHPDHATLKLRGWHRVYLNGELVSGSVTWLD